MKLAAPARLISMVNPYDYGEAGIAMLVFRQNPTMVDLDKNRISRLFDDQRDLRS